MTHKIVRFLWGIYGNKVEYTNESRIINRRYRMDDNIKSLVKKQYKYNRDFRTYVWGEDNYNMVRKYFKDVVLVSKEPFQFDLVECQYRHKLEGLKIALEEFDEVYHPDWDCVPIKPLPNNFWDVFQTRESFQANLAQYKVVKCPWREVDQRKVPNGGSCYIRGKETVEKIIKCWETTWLPRSCEPAMAQYVDNEMGGWKGIEEYWNKYEIQCSDLCIARVFKDREKPDRCFKHWQGRQ